MQNNVMTHYGRFFFICDMMTTKNIKFFKISIFILKFFNSYFCTVFLYSDITRLLEPSYNYKVHNEHHTQQLCSVNRTSFTKLAIFYLV